MNLLNPSPGALWDRLSILRLKIKGARARSLPHDHFLKEQDLLLEALSHFPLPFDSKALGEVHEKLWEATDLHREYMVLGCDAQEGLTLLKLLWDLNQERYRLISKIDLSLGTYEGREKVWERTS